MKRDDFVPPRGERYPVHSSVDLDCPGSMFHFAWRWYHMDAKQRARFEQGTRDHLAHLRRWDAKHR